MSISDAFESADRTSVAEPAGIDCVLAAGDVSEAAEIAAWLGELPESAYGMVFIEMPADSGLSVDPELLRGPERVSVTCLSGVPGEPGAALAGAVGAWLDEWLWAESQIVRNFDLWTGSEECEAMQGLWADVDRRLAKRWPGCAQVACPVRELGFPN